MIIQKDELKLFLAALIGICLSNFNIFISPLYIGSLIDGQGLSEAQAGSIGTLEIGALAIVTIFLSNWLDYFLLTKSVNPDKMIATLLVVTALVMIIILIVIGHLKEQLQFNSVIGMFSLLAIFLSPFVLFIPRQSTTANIKEQTKLKIKDENQVIDPYMNLGVLGLIMIFTFCLIDGSVWAFSERSAVNLGISDARISLILAVTQGFGILGAMLAVLIGDKTPRIYPMMVGIGITGITSMVIYHTKSDFIYSICQIGFGFGYFLALPYFIGACVRLDENGCWAARANGISLLGGAIAPFLAGTIVFLSDYKMLGSFCLSIAFICFFSTLIFQRKISKINIDNSFGTF